MENNENNQLENQNDFVEKSKKNNSKIVIIIMSCVIVLLLALVIVLFFQKNNFDKNDTPQLNDKNEQINDKNEQDSENNVEEQKKDPYIHFVDNSITLTYNESIDITKYFKYANVNLEDIIFTSDDTTVAYVSNGKIITKDVNGSVSITAEYNGLSSDLYLMVEDPDIVTMVNFEEDSYYMYVGETIEPEYSIYPEKATQKDFTWTSTNTDVATVSNGKITALKEGQTTIKLKNNAKVQCYDVSCSDETTLKIYVVKNKITVEQLKDGKYEKVNFIEDENTFSDYFIEKTYTKTFTIRIKVDSDNKLTYNDLNIVSKITGASSTEFRYIKDDETCENCFIYEVDYKFDVDKVDIENYSKVTIKLPNNSVKYFDIYTEGAYACYQACKPVLYLYPTKTLNVLVSLQYPNNILTSYPKYTNLWNVKATPSGTLYDEFGRSYYALYWDEKYYTSKENSVDFKEGFYVESKEALKFLEDKLRIIGLNEREANEFIMYWLPLLESNGKSLVYFELTEERENNNKLYINPTPDSLLRVNIHIKKVEEKTNIIQQKLKTFERNGFAAIEWGGVVH